MKNISVNIIELNQITKYEKEQIDNILLSSSDSTIYNDIDLDVYISGHYKEYKSYIALLKINNNIKGFITFFLKNIGKRKTIISPLQEALIPYGGFVLNEEYMQYEDKFVKEVYNKTKSLFSSIYIKSNPAINIESFNLNKWKIKSIPTLKINLNRKLDEIYSDIDNRIKRNLKKALHSNLEIKIKNPEKIEDVFKLSEIYEELCKSKRLKYHSAKYYFYVLNILWKKYDTKIFYAVKDKKIIAAMTACMFKDTINPWFGSTLLEYKKTEAYTQLYWEIIKYGCNNGFKEYDFLGLDIGPIAFYKKGFGGYEVPVYHLGKSTLSRKIYGKVKKWAK